MFSNNNESVCKFLHLLISESTNNKKLIDKKIESINVILSQVNSYIKEHYDERLTEKIFAMKIKYLISASSIKELELIIKPSIPYYNYSELIPKQKYHVLEEELIILSKASLGGNLNGAGYNRFIKVFKIIYPDKIL